MTDHEEQPTLVDVARITNKQFLQGLLIKYDHTWRWLDEAISLVDPIEWRELLSLPFTYDEALNLAEHVGAQISAELSGVCSELRWEGIQRRRGEFAKAFSELAAQHGVEISEWKVEMPFTLRKSLPSLPPLS